MKYSIKAFERKKSILYSIVLGGVLFILLMVIGSTVIADIRRQERYEVTERYVQFQSDIKVLIQNQITLLEGYQAYLQINGFGNLQDTLNYLEMLTQDNMKYIRNIAIIEDTTIICNYPLEENEASLGVDLSEIESQRDVVLKTKKDLLSVFQGPLDLVQGGKGYIIRQPLLDTEGFYWGQVSIVLKADEINTEISKLAQASELDILIFDDENIIYGDLSIKGHDSLSFKVIDEPIDWNVLVINRGGWLNPTSLWGRAGLISCIIAIILSALFYFFMRYLNIKYISNHDALTGVFNRQFLECYESVVCSGADRDGSLVGVMLIDLDKFKDVNDTYGHHVGDLVLEEVARIIKKCTSNNEAVFRIGGDEFLIILPKVKDCEELEKFKSRLLDVYESEFEIPSYDIFVFISVGIACDRCIDKSFAQLIKVADDHMYKMKVR